MLGDEKGNWVEIRNPGMERKEPRDSHKISVFVLRVF